MNNVPRNELNAKNKIQLCIPISKLNIAKYFKAMKPIIQDIENEIAIPMPRSLNENLVYFQIKNGKNV